MNRNSLFRPAPQQDILHFTPDFVNYSIRDYKKLILDDDDQYSIMKLLGQFQASLFFYEKTLNAQKRKSNQNQLNKKKQANKKQQRQEVFARRKTSKKVKVVCFAFWCFFCAQNLSVKKDWLEIVLITSFYYTTDVYREPLALVIFFSCAGFICAGLL